MLIAVKVFKSGSRWIASCDALSIQAEGKTQSGVVALLERHLHGLHPEFKFKARYVSIEEGLAVIEPEDIAQALGLIIKSGRLAEELTLQGFADLTGAKNHNSIYGYERADREASFSKMDELMRALGKDLLITVREGKEKK